VALRCETLADVGYNLGYPRQIPFGHIEDEIIRERTKAREFVIVSWHAIPRSATRARCMGPARLPKTLTSNQ